MDWSVFNLDYIEELHDAWAKDRASVDPAWASLFSALDDSRTEKTAREADAGYAQGRFDSLLWAYRDVGYLYARLNPLVGYLSADLHFLYDQDENLYERLTLKEFGLGEGELDLVLSAGRHLKPRTAPLREHLKALQETYCSAVGVEFLHIQNKRIRNWIIEKVESNRNKPDLTAATRKRILEDLAKAEEFEQFLHSQFIGQKRFSLEGSEVLIAALHHLADEAVDLGVEELVLGMSHRGRLNVIANVMDKPAVEIFHEFEDVPDPGMYGGSGDVKYHKGYRCDHVNADGRRVRVTLVSNPSHLESVDPVVVGAARGVQHGKADWDRKKVVPVLVHGDAAFSGQGVVPETLNLSRLKGYGTGGTIHFVVNNQIGFTTSTKDARSTFFPTDVAKMLPIPIFHVNGDEPEAVVHVTDLALEFRQEFGRDVVVDIFCYRRHGHNEGDEPSFTHPKMYQFIRYQRSVAKKYSETLDSLRVVERGEQESFVERYRAGLRADLAQSRQPRSGPAAVEGPGREPAALPTPHGETTSVPGGALAGIVGTLSSVPEGFRIHPKLERIVKEREKRFLEESRVDFPLAEALAFGSLLLEGTHVRLSGEDSARGTFSQRHSVWWDIDSGKPSPYVPLNCLEGGKARFSVYDSPLSEFSVLGFEYGFSVAVPEALVLWEAQFGDFSNGAQVVIDNFIVSGETKWGVSSAIVLLLPHGYEGQGPDHSSAHLERFLAASARGNIRVCNPSTPAQYFHLLRLQSKRRPRKPLIVMTPKSLLRNPRAVSPLEAFTGGGFAEVIEDPHGEERPSVLCLCSGKVYYELSEAKAGIPSAHSVGLVRVEQLYPFPEESVSEVLDRNSGVREVRWVQEEPRNMGAWTFVKERLERVLGGRTLRYVGRPESASTATGSHGRHAREQGAILAEALGALGVAGPMGTEGPDGTGGPPGGAVAGNGEAARARAVKNGIVAKKGRYTG